MESFKEFFLKRMLQESPANTGVFETEYSDVKRAQSLYDEIINNPDQYKKVFTIFKEHKVDLMLYQDGDDMMLYFVPKNDNFIYGYATYELLEDGGVEMVSVYNRPMYVGLAQKVYLDFILPTYKYILSNGFHSKSGRSFWRKLAIFCINQHNIAIWDTSTNSVVKEITNTNEIDEFYGDDVDFERYRIKIWK